MVQIVRSLDDISTGYSVFEKDQVLTHEQLNSVASYLDDQGRLTRVYLLGVGLVCGLRPSLQGDTVKVTKGVGVTTDGDLLRFAADTVFDQFKAYDESAPVYPPLYVDGKMIPAYELVPQNASDEAASSLTSFDADTGKSLEKMVVVLLMESYLKDDDLCSGTDCDNLGKDSINTPRVLLIEQGSAGAFLEGIATPADAYKALQEVVADRPSISSAINSPGSLASAYRAACDSIHKKISTELAKLNSVISGFLGDIFPSDPTTVWISKLNSLNSSFKTSDTGIQYYYDFLKDGVETFNDCRSFLFAEKTVCCPDVTSFPKHLLLGNVVPGANPDENRAGFYPSAMTGAQHESFSHAKFLAGKLDTLISTFQLPSGTVPIRITPSTTEETCLEERAIPYYYQVNTSKPIHRNWNHRLSRRGMETFSYSYNGSLYGAQGGAANPFGAQIGRFSFFRIEGHIGREVTSAQKALEDEIKKVNLPIAVQAVMAGTNKDRTVKPPFRYTDLHRFHYLVRNDVLQQLDEVDRFSASFKSQVVESSVVPTPPPNSDSPNPKKIAANRHDIITANTNSARSKLNKNYSAYQQDSWTGDLNNALATAGQFKSELGSFVKTEFNTPFDSVITNRSLPWLEWLDKIIVDKQKTEEDKVLFSTFIAQHPGLEHFGGVTRGGTFVLVYDENKNVVGDCMLPYICCDIPEPEPPQDTLPPPKSKPDSTIFDGIKIIPSLDKFWEDKLKDFTIPPVVNPPVTQPGIDWDRNFKNLFDSMIDIRGSLDQVTRLFEKAGATGPVIGPEIADPALNGQIRDILTKRQRIEALREKVVQPNLAPEVLTLTKNQLRAAEADLAKSFEGTARYVATAVPDVSAGSDGFKAMTTLFSSLGALESASALQTARGGLKKAGSVAGAKPEFKDMVNNILKR